ncbi:2Fe-2S iron-sulfur cluster-binding protein [Streptomyces lanatus]|uniref:2Fe-2S iron-sulfur cluster-binding protein n=1 Tax=Streptomyces lanatus TaxID=66900 RepID=A0ABV1Y7H8_9ACTN|nr:2Fe-2S iron-sulfur cluster-binding protein [Streptomyces lanatus]GHH31216.1 CDP-6-deoxy-L-threo-D-glycero-4-hexulose-3-dehydrase reductase [Streptomyces lanatus]
MTYTVSVRDSDIAFSCEQGQNVLDAAERAGWTIPYSCRKGVCDTCLGSVTAGPLDMPGSGSVRGPAEVRLCRAQPTGDIEIAPRRITARTPPVRKRLTTTVHRRRQVAPGVTVLDLRYPIGRRTPFLAGQFLNVILDGSDTRSYSLANAPQHNNLAQLHVRHEPNGVFSARILQRLEFHATVEIEAPFGEFFVEDGDGPVLLLATGTGFAPMQSIVLDHIARRLTRPLHLYWGARTLDDLYARTSLQAWTRRYPWFRFTPVLSRPHAGWEGTTGWVQAAAIADHPDLSDHHIYACGSEAMTRTAGEELAREHGMAPDRFHSDAFVSAVAAPVSVE